MALKKVRKAPAGPKVVPTQGKRYARSSTKQPKPTGINPGDLSYGLTNTSTGDQGSLGAKADRMFHDLRNEAG